MVPRPNLGGDSIFSLPGPLNRGVLPLKGENRCTHNGDSIEDREFNSNVSYFLILIKPCSILVCTHFLVVLLSLYLSWWWVGRWVRSIQAEIFQSSSHQLTSYAIAYDGFEYINGLPLIHNSPLRPKVGIMAH